MYAHSFLVSSVRGSGLEPTTSERAASGVTGFMKAALGFRLLAADFFAMSSPSNRRPTGAPRSLRWPLLSTLCARACHEGPSGTGEGRDSAASSARREEG